ncbi:MAG: ABC transporter permease [Ignavibacteriales bacterium]|nr:ABC transporter permease [Ignavibacteriales bacterium]MCF8314773.1 ABC transporter permease [Ignavibacteriales bacterium]MCF8437979.1 ABC transporter permease [Ignavibacteriales bacterium]
MGNFLFELKEGLLISLRAIRANKIRSILTTLGIVIGIAAVVLMSTAVTGIDQSFQKGVSSLGSDNLYIDKWAWFNNDIPWWQMRNRRNLNMEEYERFKDLVKLPVAVAPSIWTNQTIKKGETSIEFMMVTGTTNEYLRTTNLNFNQGRFFNEIESKGARSVVVLGSEINKQLFPFGSAVGEEIELKGNKFKVVGVLEEQGSFVMGSFNPDNQVFVPIDAVFKFFQNESFRSITINVRAPNSQLVEDVKQEAIGAMRQVRGLKYYEADDFSINQQEGLLSEINKTIGVIQIAGFVITGLSLFVGAIGIMNIMFVSVKERTKEIGIRKAIGAKRRTILSQFLAESAIICLIGGVMGFFVAFLGTRIIEQYDFPVSLQYDAVVLAFVVSLLTGLISGFAPAYSAAKMDPVEALRYE